MRHARAEWTGSLLPLLFSPDIRDLAGHVLPQALGSPAPQGASAGAGPSATVTGAHFGLIWGLLLLLLAALGLALWRHLSLTRANRRLRQEESRFRGLAEGLSEGLVITSLDGTITYVNKSAGDLLGYAESELIGMQEAQIVAEHSTQDVDSVLRRRLAGYTDRYEIELVRRDGSHVWVAVNASPYRVGGQIVGALAALSDITPRRRAEEALRESEERFRQLAENIRAVFWMSTVGRTEMLYVSPASRAVFGRLPESFVGSSTTLLEIVHPDDRERVRTVFAEASEEPRTVEYRVVHPDGSERWVLDRAFPVRDTTGRVYRVAGIAEDITARKRAQQEIMFQAQLLDTVGEAVIATDLSGRVIYWNRFAEKLYGWSREEAMGRAVLDITPAQQTRSLSEGVLERVKRGEHWSGELVLRHKDGREFPVQANDSPIRDEHGEIIGIVGISSDLTERKQLERQLLQAQKMEAVGRLAGGIAHDFNNALVSIGGYTDMVLGELAANSELREDLLEVKKGAERAASLTRQLLAFSRRQVLQTQVFDLSDAVGDMNRMLRPLIGEDIEFIISPDPQHVHVEADPVQIQQVLMNLAVNARDAMPQGGRLTAAIDTVELDEDNGWTPKVPAGIYARLCVSDTGEGIEPEALPLVFEPFFSTKEQGRGTGLGLSMVYGIVTQSGGHIRVDSRPRQGTTFEILLPATSRPAITAEATGANSESGGAATLLVAEDEPAVCNLVRRILRTRGHNVLTAANGDLALELAGEHTGAIDLLITDVVMPGMNGRELAEQLSRRRPGLKVLFMSGYAEEMSANWQSDKLDATFLAKPFTPQSLLAAVDERIGPRS